MAEIKHIGLEQLKYYHNKLKEIVVLKEHKTGSEEEWRVLSDNNLTDDLVEKIHAAGDSGFNGSYESLTNKPAIDGTELSASTTAETLGLAKSEDIPGVATAEAAGIVKPDDSTIKITEDGTISVAELSSYLKTTDAAKTYLAKTDAERDYLKSSTAEETYATQASLTDYAKTSQVETNINAAKDEMQEKINAAVGSVYTPKGSTTFTELPEPSAEVEGDVYNISEQFTISEPEKWVEQSGTYPAGTNVVCVKEDETYKWDVLTGVVDLSNYVQSSTLTDYAQKSELDAYVKTADIQTVTNGDIDTIFSE